MYLVRCCETCVLKESIIQKLSVFEGKILLGQLRKPTSFLAVQVIFICVYITNYLHFFTMFLSF